MNKFNLYNYVLQKNLIESDFIKIKYNENDFTSGKLIFGASPKYTLSMHVEDEPIFSFRIDQITYQGEDYTTDIGIDFNSAGILAPGSFFKRMEIPPEIPQKLKPWYTGREIYVSRFAPPPQWAYSEKILYC